MQKDPLSQARLHPTAIHLDVPACLRAVLADRAALQSDGCMGMPTLTGFGREAHLLWVGSLGKKSLGKRRVNQMILYHFPIGRFILRSSS